MPGSLLRSRRGRQGQWVAVGHGFEDGHGAVPLLDGDAEGNALYQALDTPWIVALGGADHALGHDPTRLGQGQHEVAIQALDAQVDLILRGEGVGNQLQWIVHEGHRLLGSCSH